MKTLKTIAFALAFAVSGIAFAEANPKANVEPTSIGQTVAELLDNPEVNLTADQDVIVKFYINEKNEIVVLDVNADDFFLKRYIKSRLNYEKVNPELVKTKTHFKILLKFTELN